MTDRDISPPQFAVIHSDSIVSEVYVQLRESLLSGSLKASQQLKESVLAAQMGVSRSPVREALRLLEQSGLVVKTHNRSYAVSPFAASDIPELAALRFADETLAVRYLVQQNVNLAPLAAVVEKMRAMEDLSDSYAVSAADAEFHAVTIQLTGLPRLIARYENLRDQIQFTMLTIGTRFGLNGDGQVERHELLLKELIRAQNTRKLDDVLQVWGSHVLLGMQPSNHIISVPGRNDPS